MLKQEMLGGEDAKNASKEHDQKFEITREDVNLKVIEINNKNSKTGGKNDEIKLSEDEIINCKKAFDLFDVDNSGQIDPSDVQIALDAYGSDQSADIFRILSGFDMLEGKIDFNAFLAHINNRLMSEGSKANVQNILTLFNNRRRKNNRPGALKLIADELGVNISEEEFAEILQKYSNESGDSDFTFEKLYKVIIGRLHPK